MSGPVALLGFNFLIILLVCSAVAKGILYLLSDFIFYANDTAMVFIFLNYRLNSRHIKGFVVWISFYLRGFTWCFFHNIYVMSIEWMCYCLFISYCFISWVNEILSEVKNPLLVKNGLLLFQNALLLANPFCVTSWK